MYKNLPSQALTKLGVFHSAKLTLFKFFYRIQIAHLQKLLFFQIKPKQDKLSVCCFGKMIDPTKNICCNYGIKDLIYGAQDTGCCRFDNYRKGLKDYFEIYNKRTQICCGGKLVNRVGEKTSCCIQSAYNVDEHVCCSGRVS